MSFPLLNRQTALPKKIAGEDSVADQPPAQPGNGLTEPVVESVEQPHQVLD